MRLITPNYNNKSYNNNWNNNKKNPRKEGVGNQNECSAHESMEVGEGERPTMAIETVCVGAAG